MIGIDIPVPGFPFMDADNYGISQMTGTWFADHVDEIYGGWDNVDVVFLSWTAASGESTALRTTGVADVLPNDSARREFSTARARKWSA